jgi:uridine kinase
MNHHKRDNSINVSLQGKHVKLHEVPRGTSLQELISLAIPEGKATIVGAKVDNRIRNLTYKMDKNCHVHFLDTHSEAGMRIYRNSLTFLLIRAANDLHPHCRVTIEHTLGKGLYGEIDCPDGVCLTDYAGIADRMRQIVAENINFIRRKIPRSEAVELFTEENQTEKIATFKYLPSDTVPVFHCGGLHDYFYEQVVPSTGYLRHFELQAYPPGFILRFPDPTSYPDIPPYVEQPKLFGIYRESARWAKILGINNSATLNQTIATGEIHQVIQVAEALHEKKIAKIADQITSDPRNRVILIAGPSSSGKTTFAKRLLVQLRVNGVVPITISVDDYFVNRDKTPRDEDGNFDFETIDAIDMELFNEHLAQLLDGKTVPRTCFNFHKGAREFTGEKLRINANQPIIIEGIHALNERLTQAIPREEKFKIYISALTQLNIDSHNRIPTTEARLLRRIVRDHQFRGRSAMVTLAQWPSVRRGEEKYIFPFQEDADTMFNSALVYELSALKFFAEPILTAIPVSAEEYPEAKRLLQLLSHFLHVDSRLVPGNSILREFVGGSIFPV